MIRRAALGVVAALLSAGCFGDITSPPNGQNELIYIAQVGSTSFPFRLLVLDGATRSVVDSINLNAYPYAVAATPDGEYVYVSTSIQRVSNGPRIGGYSVIDTRSAKVIMSTEVGHLPFALAVSPDGGWAYMADASDSTVWAIKTPVFRVSRLFSRGVNEIASTIHLPALARGVTFSDTEPLAYVSLTNDHVAVIDAITHQILTEIAVGSIPYLLDATPDGERLYVANFGSDDVTVIDLGTNTVIDTVDVSAGGGDGPYGVAITPDGARVYVSNFTSGNVSVIEVASNAVVTTIDVDNVGLGIAMAPSGRYLYVTGRDSVMSVIETTSNTLVESIPTNGYIRGVAAPARN